MENKRHEMSKIFAIYLINLATLLCLPVSHGVNAASSAKENYDKAIAYGMRGQCSNSLAVAPEAVG